MQDTKGNAKSRREKRNGGSIQTLIREVGAREGGGRGENNLGSDRYPYLARDTPIRRRGISISLQPCN